MVHNENSYDLYTYQHDSQAVVQLHKRITLLFHLHVQVAHR